MGTKSKHLVSTEYRERSKQKLPYSLLSLNYYLLTFFNIFFYTNDRTTCTSNCEVYKT